MPPTVQAVLAARIDLLPPEDKRLLQSAAVIGKDVPFRVLAALAETGPEEMRRGLIHLQSAEFLYETMLFPDLEYSFKHALTHDVAYGSLLHERRRALHARVVGRSNGSTQIGSTSTSTSSPITRSAVSLGQGGGLFQARGHGRGHAHRLPGRRGVLRTGPGRPASAPRGSRAPPAGC